MLLLLIILKVTTVSTESFPLFLLKTVHCSFLTLMHWTPLRSFISHSVFHYLPCRWSSVGCPATSVGIWGLVFMCCWIKASIHLFFMLTVGLHLLFFAWILKLDFETRIFSFIIQVYFPKIHFKVWPIDRTVTAVLCGSSGEFVLFIFDSSSLNFF